MTDIVECYGCKEALEVDGLWGADDDNKKVLVVCPKCHTHNVCEIKIGGYYDAIEVQLIRLWSDVSYHVQLLQDKYDNASEQ